MKVVRVSKKVYETERKDVESRISKLEDNCFRNSETVDIPTKGCMEKENAKIKSLKRKFGETNAQIEIWEGEGRPPIEEKFIKLRKSDQKNEAKEKSEEKGGQDPKVRHSQKKTQKMFKGKNSPGQERARFEELGEGATRGTEKHALLQKIHK